MATEELPKIIARSEYQQVLRRVWDNHQSKEAVEQVLAYKDLVYDDGPQPTPVSSTTQNMWHHTVVEDVEPLTGKPTLRINVQHMVASYIGDGYEIQVNQEHWNNPNHNYHHHSNEYHQLAIHLRKINDNPNCEIITIREPMHRFPSPELRAKLELLRYQ